MTNWLPTRYLAASIDKNSLTCDSYLSPSIADKTQLDQICAEFPFNNLTQLYYFALAPSNSDVKG